MTQPIASTSITFTGKDGEKNIPAGGISLELDTQRNGEVYGEIRTTFRPGDNVYFLVAPHGTYTLMSSAGLFQYKNKNVPVERTETVIFTSSRTMALEYLPIPQQISWRWLGLDAGIPLFNGREITLPAKAVGIGVLRVTYKTAEDRLFLHVSNLGKEKELPVVVQVVNADGESASLVVNYTVDGEDLQQAQFIDIEVTDFCTGEPVIGAEVFVDNKSCDKTNSSGMAFAGKLNPRQEHTLLVKADGYTDSDKDVLFNDSFIVPEQRLG